ncbi:MAG: hypothetical protein N2691_05495 [Patescibacteria group bacterium]|nr:hypothetical protein [Patescibacteria group bacterium]
MQSQKEVIDQIDSLFTKIQSNDVNSPEYLHEITSLEVVLDFVKKKQLIGEVEYKKYISRLKLLKDAVEGKKVKNTTRNIAAGNADSSILQSFLKRFTLQRKLILLALVIIVTSAGLLAYVNSKNENTGDVKGTNVDKKGKILRFRGVLRDTKGLPVDSKVDVLFRLYASEKDKDAVYSGACTGVNGIVPDVSGRFEIVIGSDCGMNPLPEEVLRTYNELYLGVTIGKDPEMKPRQRISTVQNAANSETVQGLPVGDEESSIPFIDSEGAMNIGAFSPTLRSSQGTFTLEGRTMVVQTAEGSAGVIALRPDTGGYVIIDNARLGVNTREPRTELDIAGNVAVTGDMEFDGPITTFYQNSGGSFAFYTSREVTDLTKPSLTIRGESSPGIEVNGNVVAEGIVFSSNKSRISTAGGTDILIGSSSRPQILVRGDSKLGFLTDRSVSDITIGGSVAPDKDGMYRLGSETHSWKSIYTSELLIDEEGIGGYWQRKGKTLYPSRITDDILLGSATVSTATVRLNGLSNGTSYIMGKGFGVGTRDPRNTLSVAGESSTTAITSIGNSITTDAPSVVALRLQLGTSSTGSKSQFIEFVAGATTESPGKKVGSIRLNNAGVVFESAGADFAELMYISEETQPGNVIGISESGLRKARKGDRLVGVVSDIAAFVGNTNITAHPNNATVGLVGQVPVFISTENGPVKQGSRVSLSRVSGWAAMRKEADENTLGVIIADSATIESSLRADLCPPELQKSTDPSGYQVRCGRVPVLISIQDADREVRQAQSQTSSTGDNRMNHSGKAIIPRGSTGTTVNAPVQEDSIILITALGENPIAISVRKQHSCEQETGKVCRPWFEVYTSAPVTTDVHFNWLIVN